MKVSPRPSEHAFLVQKVVQGLCANKFSLLVILQLGVSGKARGIGRTEIAKGLIYTFSLFHIVEQLLRLAAAIALFLSCGQETQLLQESVEVFRLARASKATTNM